MENNIQSEIVELKMDVPKLPDLSNEYLLSLVCCKYFYYDGEFTYKDFTSCFTDGKDDGGIDAIYADDSDETQPRLILIQSKYVEDISKEEVENIFKKIHRTVNDFRDYRTGQYNRRLKRIYTENYDFLSDKVFTISLVLFTTANPEEDKRINILERLNTLEELSGYEISVFYKDEITEQISNINEPKLFVPEGEIQISNEDGSLKYEDNGLLVNLKALSLRKLFNKYRDKGLFEQNFRYFIRNKRIDDSINRTIEKRPHMFWFMNNGIIIACKDFVPDGNTVKLYDFSIVNGCQTATLIGEYKGKHQEQEFLLPCKIVKPIGGEEFELFVADIAEASNSQKPISDRDLKSNKPEQRKIQNELKKNDPKIYLNIKRGEQLITTSKKKQLAGWQYISNDLFGQIILAFHLQQPGTARSSKKTIFAVGDIYNRVFKRTFEKSNIIDLLKLDSYYNEIVNKGKITDDDQQNVANHARFFFLAIVGFMIKHKRGIIKDLSTINNKEDWEKEISKDEITGNLFDDHVPDDFMDILESLIMDLIQELSDLYQTRAKEEGSVSNFFKKDDTYRNVILKRIINRYYDNIIKNKELKQYLAIFK